MFLKKLKATPNSVARFLAIITFFLATINIANQIAIYSFGLDKELLLLFNMDKEVNIPTLFSVILLLICASLVLISYKNLNPINNKLKKRWRALRWLFIFLALDEGLQIHEILIIPSIKPMLPAIFTVVWVIPYGILAIIALVYFLPVLASLPSVLRQKTLLSGAIYLLGALGFEMIGSFLVRTGDIRLHGISYGAIFTIEETLEMIGLIIFVHTLLRYIVDYQKQRLEINMSLSSDYPRTSHP